jgi:uncharacterized protein (TIGR03663 family)
MPMTPTLRRVLLAALVLGLALALRLPDLGKRPMHADEANQAVKLGALLERGEYRFDPDNHHGPTLYYFALLPAWGAGARTLADLTETTVRLTPVIFGVLAVGLLAWAAAPLGSGVGWMAAAFLAVSPTAVYYSRYFVQETLLLAFFLGTVGAGVRGWAGGGRGWTLAAGAGFGLMLATKASAPVFVALAVVAAAVAGIVGRTGSGAGGRSGLVVRELLPALLAALAVAALFYSSFGTHPAGLRDAVLTYLPMADRLTAEPAGHEKPWWYYGSLFFWRRDGGYVWDQTLLLALAAAGLVFAVGSGERGRKAVALYALGLGVAFSAVPYKTPWQAIHLVVPLAVLAAVAVEGFWRGGPAGRVGAGVLAAGAGLQLLWQTNLAVFERPADPRNPLAYVHSVPDVMKVARLAERAGPGVVQVIAPEYWPLPWYLRHRPEIGYWATVPERCDGVLLLVAPELAEEVRGRLRGEYEESILGLRPGVLLIAFRRQS